VYYYILLREQVNVTEKRLKNTTDRLNGDVEPPEKTKSKRSRHAKYTASAVLSASH